MPTLMIGAGGTGGHVYPALAVAEALHRRAPTAEPPIFVGTRDGFERPLVEASGLQFRAYHEIEAGPLNGVGLSRALLSLAKLARGTWQSWRILGHERPGALLLTGGWANVPLALAAALRRVPMLVYLPDIEPGLTIRVVARLAQRVAMTAPQSDAYFRPGQGVALGYPLRQAVLRATRAAGLAHFGLDENWPVLLVFGGSRGARSLNIALATILPDLLERAQVIHISGTTDWAASQARTPQLSPQQAARYRAFPYLHDDMGLAFACADLALCRSGASTLGELPYFGLPAILVPYPHAWRYQKVNADYLAQQGAALVLSDEALGEQLWPMLCALLDDAPRRQAMRQAALALRQADSAERIAELWLSLAQEASR